MIAAIPYLVSGSAASLYWRVLFVASCIHFHFSSLQSGTLVPHSKTLSRHQTLRQVLECARDSAAFQNVGWIPPPSALQYRRI
jgi:hypothetical protein